MMEDDFLIKVIGIRDTYSVSIKGDVYYVDAYPDEDGSCDIDLRALEIPPNVVFENEGDVTLNIDELPENVKFFNEGDVYLYQVESIHSSVEFRNEGNVFLESLIGVWSNEWKGNIEGIDHKRLLNLMIKKGMFI